MERWPDRLRRFERFGDLPGPLRLSKFRAFVRSLVFTGDLQRFDTGMCTPMRHLGVEEVSGWVMTFVETRDSPARSARRPAGPSSEPPGVLAAA